MGARQKIVEGIKAPKVLQIAGAQHLHMEPLTDEAQAAIKWIMLLASCPGYLPSA
jgi:hypothetical protein